MSDPSSCEVMDVDEEAGGTLKNDSAGKPGRPVGQKQVIYSKKECEAAFKLLMSELPPSRSNKHFIEKLKQAMKAPHGVERTPSALKSFVRGKLKESVPELYRRIYMRADAKEMTKNQKLFLREYMAGTSWEKKMFGAGKKGKSGPAGKGGQDAAAAAAADKAEKAKSNEANESEETAVKEPEKKNPKLEIQSAVPSETRQMQSERGDALTNEKGKGLSSFHLCNPLDERFNFNPTSSSTPLSITRQLQGTRSKAGGYFWPPAKMVNLFQKNVDAATIGTDETERGDTPTNEEGKRHGSLPSLLQNPLYERINFKPTTSDKPLSLTRGLQGESSKGSCFLWPQVEMLKRSAPTSDQNLHPERGDIPTNGERTAPSYASVPQELSTAKHSSLSSIPVSNVVDTTVIRSIIDESLKHHLKSFRREVVDMVRCLTGKEIQVKQEENVTQIIDLTEDDEETHPEEVAALQVETGTEDARTLEEDPSQPLGNGQHEHSKGAAEQGSHSSTQNVERQRLLSDSYEQVMYNVIDDLEVVETGAAPLPSAPPRTTQEGCEAMTLDGNLSETLDSDKDEEDGDEEQVHVNVASCIESDSRAREFEASPLRARLSTLTLVEVFEVEDSNTLDPNPFRVIEEIDGSFTIKHVSSVDAGQWSVGATVGHRENSTITEELSDVERRDITEVCKAGPSLSPMTLKAKKKVSFMKADISSGTKVVKALFKKMD